MRNSSGYQSKPAVNAGAETCRVALSAVMSYRARGWGKQELAAWLAGPYAGVACPHTDIAPDDGEEPAPTSGTIATSVDGDQLRQIVQQARSRVRELLQGPRDEYDAAVRTLLDRGRVLEFWDESGDYRVAPVNHCRMRLEERILSLAVAYYLMCPEEIPTRTTGHGHDPRVECA